jgi:nucleoside-diphosphate-sugar epimerase
MISVYGSTGFIGGRYLKMYSDTAIPIARFEDTPQSKDILYFISTTHNYHIFDNPHKDIETNLNKLISVLEASKKKYSQDITFNFISSWFVYGMNSTMDTKETDPCDPRGFYSITKRAAEQMLICYCQTMNINYRILRLTNILGETDVGVSAKKNAMQYMISLLKKNQTVKIYDGGSNIRDFMYVDDACRAIDVCLNSSSVGEIINISNSQPVSIRDAIEYCKKRIGSTSEIVSIDTPNFHKVVQVKNVRLNNEKLRSYGYTYTTDTWQALDHIIDTDF